MTALSYFQWILLATGTITWFIYYVHRKLTFWQRRGIGGPKPTFLFGNLLQNFSKPLPNILQDNYTKYGKVYGSYTGLKPSLVVGDPEILRKICVKDFHVFPQGFDDFTYLSPIEQNFLTNIWGEKWKRMRSLISPTFSSGKVKKMFTLIKACNKDAQQELIKLTSTQESTFDPKNFWGRYNLDVIAKCCFAANLNVYDETDDTMMKRFVDVFEPRMVKFLLIIALPKWFTELFHLTPSAVDSLEYLRDLTYALIEKRKNGEFNKSNDFLQLLIDLNGEEETDDQEGNNSICNNNKQAQLTNDEIVGASVVFLIAGYETTSTLLTWACYRLATNPEIQDKLYQEVSTADIEDYDVLNGLPYLDAVINETLRIDPPVLFFQRKNHSDYVLPGSNAKLPKGTSVTVPVYAVHHDPENYTNPEVFDPQRLIDHSPKPYTFLPFGLGPRICIGMRFALINAKLALASLIRDFILIRVKDTPEKVEYIKGPIILTPKSLTLGIKPRNKVPVKSD